MTRRREPARGRGSLSEREGGVLAVLIKGLTNREIAEELGISTGTVKKHVSHMLSKTALKTRTALATRVADDGSEPRTRRRRRPIGSAVRAEKKRAARRATRGTRGRKPSERRLEAADDVRDGRLRFAGERGHLDGGEAVEERGLGDVVENAGCHELRLARVRERRRTR